LLGLGGAARQLTGQQLVEKHAQRVDIRAGIDVLLSHRLLGAHVPGRAELLAILRLDGTVDRFGDPEIDDLGVRVVPRRCHEHVGRLDVAVDDPLLMGVLHPVADLFEELEAFPDAEAAGIAEPGDGLAGHILHREVWTSILGSACFEDERYVRMAHERERLPLAFEASEDLGAVPISPDELQGDPALDRGLLFSLVNLSHSSGADLTEDPVRSDAAALDGS